ncbi:hypothetical protein DL93DRAFT_2230677 [Clavulina sp. PMI_390]|nr:hypothetical protein DL93DRAFT_2230677 [Clavulina sp. PMI_390]
MHEEFPRTHDASLALPDDVLLIIFKHVVKNPLYPRWAVPVTLSHVCVQWRLVVVDCSSFWTYLGVSSAAFVPLIPLFAERCRHRQLALSFDGEFGRPKRTQDQMTNNSPSIRVKLSPSSAAKISRVYFSSAYAFGAIHLENGAYEQLDLNSLVIDPYSNGPQVITGPARLLLRARRVVLKNTSMATLRESELSDIVEDFQYCPKHQSVDEVWDTLKHLPMPRLRRLKLCDVDTFESPSYEGSVDFPLLESVELVLCHFGFPRFIGTVIRAPNLRSVTIKRETYFE